MKLECEKVIHFLLNSSKGKLLTFPNSMFTDGGGFFFFFRYVQISLEF